jgi:hypothetical protein
MDEASIDDLRRQLARAPAGAGGRDELGYDGVWPANLDAVRAFLAADTQWRTVSLPGSSPGTFGLGPSRLHVLGLDYAGARAGIEAAGIPLNPEVWEGVRVMEAAARDALNQVEA